MTLAVLAFNGVRYRCAYYRDSYNVTLRIFHSLTDGFGNLNGLARAYAYTAVLVAYDYKRRKAHVAAALYGLGYAVDADDSFLKFRNGLFKTFLHHYPP